MKNNLIFVALCMVAGFNAAIASGETKHTIIIPKEIYDMFEVKYTSQHDIVDIMVPLNAINFGDTDSDSKSDSVENILTDITCFFVEADDKDGKREYKGIYRFKNDKIKMILPTGRASSASTNNNKLVFFGASDGLYVYNVDSDSADKYGTFTDSIKRLATDGTGKTIYILTDDHKLYKVTNNGETKELLDKVADAQEIVIDDEGNLYYYNSKNEVYVKTADKIIKVQNLPADPKTIKLVRPPFIMSDSIPLLCNNALYLISSNGTADSDNSKFSPETVPTAIGGEAVFVQFYGHDKKLYEFNSKNIDESKVPENIKNKSERIRNQANKKKHTLGAKKD